MRVRVDKQDRKIGPLALANDCTLLTHNRRDFGRNPSIQLADWPVEFPGEVPLRRRSFHASWVAEVNLGASSRVYLLTTWPSHPYRSSEARAVRKSPREVARQLIEADADDALYEAECLAVLHHGHRGEGYYAAVLAEVRRLLESRLPRPLFTAG